MTIAVGITGILIDIVTATAISGAGENSSGAARIITPAFTNHPITATIDMAQTLTIRVIRMACTRAQTTRIADKLTILSARIFIDTAAAASCLSSATRRHIARLTATVSCAVTKKAISITRRISSAAAFIDNASSLIRVAETLRWSTKVGHHFSFG